MWGGRLLLGLSLTQLWHRPGTTKEFLKHPSKSRGQKGGDKLMSHNYSVTAATVIPLLPKGVFVRWQRRKSTWEGVKEGGD